MWRFRKNHRRIGIVGTQRSGKTVFLTSLINHLRDHNPHDFVIGEEKARITKFRSHGVTERDCAEFNYAAYRDALVYKGKWPKKTKDISHYVCSFRRSDWHVTSSELRVFDFPGERAADAAIVANARYEDWCEQILRHISSNTEYRVHAKDFLDQLDKEGTSAKDIVSAYRLALGRFTLAYKALISPSVFLLDEKGRSAVERPAEELAEERISGLPPDPKTGEDRQFAPLSKAKRERNPEMVKRFAANYTAYRRTVALPAFAYLRTCHRMVVLIDIPSILAGGVGRYNDIREILASFFDVLQPDSGIGASVRGALDVFLQYNPLTIAHRILRGPCLDSLQRVAFVATKKDLVRPEDQRDERLRALLQEMTEKFKYDREDLLFKWFECSAVVSAHGADALGHLRGRAYAPDNPSMEVREFPVSALPKKWPDNWKPGDYSFPHVYPEVPANKANPPRQDGLDRVFSYISED